ncbi:hypothetical protein [Streptomyces sp. SAI-229]|uniref:hypothetical protein n=1 Tax=Streptomyces sp. SAI-229 TaxID=3377731 RepID=UPI003C7B4EC7
MTIPLDSAHQSASHLYRATRDFVQSRDDTLPGKLGITPVGRWARTSTAAAWTG